jgi:catechol 2,3-dioxygenase-like lactoylglutathione lyase family enzyme
MIHFPGATPLIEARLRRRSPVDVAANPALVRKREKFMAITVTSLDHLVLTVADIGRTIAFYRDHLGMTPVEFAPNRWALTFGRQKINLQQEGVYLDPNAKHAAFGSADICLLVAQRIEEVTASLERAGIPIVQGPVRRIGAVGPLDSVYVYDPDENLIELSWCGA